MRFHLIVTVLALSLFSVPALHAAPQTRELTGGIVGEYGGDSYKEFVMPKYGNIGDTVQVKFKYAGSNERFKGETPELKLVCAGSNTQDSEDFEDYAGGWKLVNDKGTGTGTCFGAPLEAVVENSNKTVSYQYDAQAKGYSRCSASDSLNFENAEGLHAPKGKKYCLWRGPNWKGHPLDGNTGDDMFKIFPSSASNGGFFENMLVDGDKPLAEQDLRLRYVYRILDDEDRDHEDKRADSSIAMPAGPFGGSDAQKDFINFMQGKRPNVVKMSLGCYPVKVSLCLNQPPEPEDDSLAVREDGAIFANLIKGTNGATADKDPEGQALKITKILVKRTDSKDIGYERKKISDPFNEIMKILGLGNAEMREDSTPGKMNLENGYLEWAADGAITYQPYKNFNGIEEFEYEVADDKGAISRAKVKITVKPYDEYKIDDMFQKIVVPRNFETFIVNIDEYIDNPTHHNVIVEAIGGNSIDLSKYSKVTKNYTGYKEHGYRFTATSKSVLDKNKAKVSIIENGKKLKFEAQKVNFTGRPFKAYMRLTDGHNTHRRLGIGFEYAPPPLIVKDDSYTVVEMNGVKNAGASKGFVPAFSAGQTPPGATAPAIEVPPPVFCKNVKGGGKAYKVFPNQSCGYKHQRFTKPSQASYSYYRGELGVSYKIPVLDNDTKENAIITSFKFTGCDEQSYNGVSGCFKPGFSLKNAIDTCGNATYYGSSYMPVQAQKQMCTNAALNSNRVKVLPDNHEIYLSSDKKYFIYRAGLSAAPTNKTVKLSYTAKNEGADTTKTANVSIKVVHNSPLQKDYYDIPYLELFHDVGRGNYLKWYYNTVGTYANRRAGYYNKTFYGDGIQFYYRLNVLANDNPDSSTRIERLESLEGFGRPKDLEISKDKKYLIYRSHYKDRTPANKKFVYVVKKGGIEYKEQAFIKIDDAREILRHPDTKNATGTIKSCRYYKREAGKELVYTNFVGKNRHNITKCTRHGGLFTYGPASSGSSNSGSSAAPSRPSGGGGGGGATGHYSEQEYSRH